MNDQEEDMGICDECGEAAPQDELYECPDGLMRCPICVLADQVEAND